MDTLAERWIRWWYAAGGPLQPAWRVASDAGREALAISAPISRHECIALGRAVRLTQPPEPHLGLLQWIALPEPLQALSLQLVERICAPGPHRAQCQPDHEGWCRSLAKALRPGLWLPPESVDPRLLLGAWIGPQRWMRMRLAWPSATLGIPPQGLPQTRLDALWLAVLWHVSRGDGHAGQA